MPIIRFLAYRDAALLDLTGPMQVFRSASLYAADLNRSPSQFYQISIVSIDGGLVPTAVGVSIDTAVAAVGPADTLFVAGGADNGVDAARANPAIVEFVRQQSQASRRTASISTGAFLLAQTGLLDGRRATTHWMDRERLAAEFPKIDVVADAAYIADGAFWTSAGVLSAADIALAMVEQDLGRRVANFVARVMISDSRRAMGDPQFTARAAARETEMGRVHDLIEWIAENPNVDLSAVALAGRAHLSVRSLHRHFFAQTGKTPAKFVEQARVQAAQHLLSSTENDLSRIAAACGFGSAVVMQRAFSRTLGLSAAQYRARALSRGESRQY